MAERDARISMSAGPFNPRDNPSDRLLCTSRQNSKLWLLARSKAFRIREARWFEGEVVLLMVSSIICVGENKTSLVAHGETGEFLQEQWHPGPSSSNVQVSGPGWRLAH
ncbi:hypothetical protein E4U61_006111 [Claviceps capensis]|nr:hypothetical protein E4U61_006111 [Claviceps capensis]